MSPELWCPTQSKPLQPAPAERRGGSKVTPPRRSHTKYSVHSLQQDNNTEVTPHSLLSPGRLEMPRQKNFNSWVRTENVRVSGLLREERLASPSASPPVECMLAGQVGVGVPSWCSIPSLRFIRVLPIFTHHAFWIAPVFLVRADGCRRIKPAHYEFIWSLQEVYIMTHDFRISLSLPATNWEILHLNKV